MEPWSHGVMFARLAEGPSPFCRHLVSLLIREFRRPGLAPKADPTCGFCGSS